MAYRFVVPTISSEDGVEVPNNFASPDIYTGWPLAPTMCRELARTIVQGHEEGLSWESRTRYAPGSDTAWDVNRKFRSSKNIRTDLQGLPDAYAAMEREAIRAFPTLGLDPTRASLKPVEDQCLIYTEGDHVGDHADDSASHMEEDGQTVWHLIKPQRHVVAVMWLTTNTEDGAGEFEFAGGELRFNSLIDEQNDSPLVVQPMPGKMVVFPASAWFRHEVLPVKAGVRLALTRWWEVVPSPAVQ